MQKTKKYILPLLVFLFTLSMLSIIQIMAPKGMLMLDRFIKGGGWIEALLLSSYGSMVTFQMQAKEKVPRWRIISWSVFSLVFFSQLILGLVVSDKFLLTGKLHIPVPAMMISGPIYRGQLSIMTLLFLSTIVLSGPAWCSHLCYFGAWDGIASIKKKGKTVSFLHNLIPIKITLLSIVVIFTLIIKWLEIPVGIATAIGIIFGIFGLIIILTISTTRGKMVHCLSYCPIGSLVNLFKWVSPFRMHIDENSCTMCMKCTPSCKYDALKLVDLQKHKPDFTCTLCGDCLSVCKDNSIKYKLFNLTSETSRRTYLFITISLHVIFMAMGRI